MTPSGTETPLNLKRHAVAVVPYLVNDHPVRLNSRFSEKVRPDSKIIDMPKLSKLLKAPRRQTIYEPLYRPRLQPDYRSMLPKNLF